MQIQASSTIPIFQIGKRSGDDTLKVTQGGNYVASEISRWANCGRYSLRRGSVMLLGQMRTEHTRNLGQEAELASLLRSEDGPQPLNPIHDLPLTSQGLGLLV